MSPHPLSRTLSTSVNEVYVRVIFYCRDIRKWWITGERNALICREFNANLFFS